MNRSEKDSEDEYMSEKETDSEDEPAIEVAPVQQPWWESKLVRLAGACFAAAAGVLALALFSATAALPALGMAFAVVGLAALGVWYMFDKPCQALRGVQEQGKEKLIQMRDGILKNVGHIPIIGTAARVGLSVVEGFLKGLDTYIVKPWIEQNSIYPLPDGGWPIFLLVFVWFFTRWVS